MHCTGIPNDKKFYLKLLNMKTLKCDSYSKIKYDCFTLKMTKNTNRKWKVSLKQPHLFLRIRNQKIIYKT